MTNRTPSGGQHVLGIADCDHHAVETDPSRAIEGHVADLTDGGRAHRKPFYFTPIRWRDGTKVSPTQQGFTLEAADALL